MGLFIGSRFVGGSDLSRDLPVRLGGRPVVGGAAALHVVPELRQAGRVWWEAGQDQQTADRRDRRKGDPELNAISARMGLAVGMEGFARQTEAVIARPDSRPLLSAIAVPTAIIVGDADPLTPPALSKEMAGLIPQARLTIAKDCGHVVTLERPAELNAALAAWLDV